MAGTWPNLDSADLLTRIRTYLNEATAKFYTDAEIYLYMSVAVKDIAQRTLCIKRIISAKTSASTRTVSTNAYKVIHVEYVPSSGRPVMLPKIDALKIGNQTTTGTAPQYWFEDGNTIGIEPLPDGVYSLRLYVADIPKIVVESAYAQADWSGGTGWSVGSSSASHTGTSAGDLTYSGTIVDATNYTVEFTISGVGTGGTITPYFGSTAGSAITYNGVNGQTAVTNATSFKFNGNNSITISDIRIYKEADLSATNTQTELPPAYQHLVVVYSVIMGLAKDLRLNPAKMLDTLFNSETLYLKQNISDIIPDGIMNARGK